MRMITVFAMAFAVSCTKTVPVLKAHDSPDTSDTGVVVTMPVDTGIEPVTTDTGTIDTGTTDTGTTTTTPCEELTWYLDFDDDGYGTSTDTVQACEQPDGYVDNADDCDDICRTCYPGGEEIYYNGIDEDCDDSTNDKDQDGDGTIRAFDCDDSDPSRYPGGEEIAGDDIDQNCDGYDLAIRCENLGYHTGDGDWSCPEGMRMPKFDTFLDTADWLSVESCVTDYDRTSFNEYVHVAYRLTGPGCDWNETWDLTPNFQVFDTEDGGYHCGDYQQLKICVEYAN